MRIIRGFSIIPGIVINWYTFNYKRYYYVAFHWLFWYWSIPQEFEWDKEGGEE